MFSCKAYYKNWFVSCNDKSAKDAWGLIYFLGSEGDAYCKMHQNGLKILVIKSTSLCLTRSLKEQYANFQNFNILTCSF